MSPYSERSTNLALEASVAVLALSNPDGTDLEFLPLKPRLMPQSDIAELRSRWPGRGLRVIGVIGLVGRSARIALKELPEQPEQVSRLADAFAAYVHVLLGGEWPEPEQPDDFESFMRGLYQLDDPRPKFS